MADRYWVGGTATWDATAGTKWSATSGGAGGASVPTAADNVFFNAASGAGTVTVSGARPCLSFNATGFTGTLAGTATPDLQVYGNLTFGSGMTVANTLSTVTFLGTGSFTITSNGKSFVAVTFNNAGDTWTLQDALTATGTVTLTAGTLALSSYTLTCALFFSSGTGVRTIAFDTGKIVVTGSGTAWNTTTTTSLTTTGTNRNVEPTLTAAQTLTAGSPAEASTFDLVVPSSVGNNTLTLTSGAWRNLTFGNASYTVANTALTIYGNVTIQGTTPTFTSGINAWTFSVSGSAIQQITTNGKTINWPLTKGNSTTSTLQLQDNLTMVSGGKMTLQFGILNLQSYTLTTVDFTTSFSTARTLNFGTGKVVISASGQWASSTGTNFSSSGSKLVEAVVNTSQTTVIDCGSITEANTFDVSVIQTGAGTLNLFGNVRNLTFPNSAYTVSNNAVNIYGDLTIAGTTPTFTAGSNTWTFAATGSTVQNITSGGETLDFPITKGGAATSTLRLQDNFAMGFTRTFTLTLGILELQSYTFTLGLFSSSNSNVRSINFGTGKILLSGTDAATSWTTSTGTNFTSSGNTLIEVTAPSSGAVTKTLTFGTSITEANTMNVSIISGGGTGTIAISGNVRNLSFANATYTISDNAISIFGNLLISGTSPTFSGGTGTWTFAATGSVIQDVTTNGEVLNFPIAKSGSTTSTVRLQDSLTMNTARVFTLNSGIVDLQSYVLTTGELSSSNSNVRSISFGTGKVITNAVSMATSTNFTSTGSKEVETVNSSGSRTFNFGTGVTESNTLNLRIVAGGTTTTYTVTGRINNFYAENTLATMSATFGPTVYGDFFLGGTSINWSSGSGTTTFAATSGTKSITTNGVTMQCAVTFNGIGGTWQLQSNMTVGISFLTTLTAGAVDMNTYNLSTGRFTLTASANARSINFHSNEITITDNQGYFSPNFFTTLTMTGSGSLYSFSGSNIFNINPTSSTILINVNLSDTTLAPNIKISSGSEVFFNNPAKVNNLTLSAGSAAIRPLTQTNAPIDIYGNFLAESTWAGQFSATGDPSFNPPYYYNILDFKSSSGVKTITSNGKKIDAIIRFDNTSGSWRFEDDFAQNVQSTTNDFARYMDLSNGTVDLNGKIVAVNQFRRLTFGTVSTLTFGSGELRILSDDTAWPPSGSTYGPCYIDFNNTIINRDTGKISFSSSGRTTFLGGGSGAYANTIAPPLQQLSGSSNGLLIKVISAKLVIADLLGNVSNPSYFYFDPQTYYFDKFTLTAPVGQQAYLLSNGGPGPTYSFVLNSGIANCQRLYVQDSNATPATNTWYAGSTSTNGGNNTGWIFANAPQASGNMLMLFA